MRGRGYVDRLYKIDPDLDLIRDDPRFKEIKREVGLRSTDSVPSSLSFGEMDK